ncbi:MAG: YfhO family protein [Clostridia bacterium]|nr:YfhO family protein [Clostridia bacterium]
MRHRLYQGYGNSGKDGLFLFSIPYDEGWSVKIDGKNAETRRAAEYLLSAEIEAGRHEIELQYTVPGIKTGTVISLLSLLGFCVMILIKRKKF